jgi:hypothetical protein
VFPVYFWTDICLCLEVDDDDVKFDGVRLRL